MKTKTTTHIIIGTMLGAVLCIDQAAYGQSEWVGGTGDYSDAANWNPNGVPALGTEIFLNSGTAIRTGNDNNHIERAANSTIDGGNLVINNARFLNARGGAATFNMVSGSLTQNNSTYFIVGQNNSGVMNQSGGLVDVTVGRGFFLTDGNNNSVASYFYFVKTSLSLIRFRSRALCADSMPARRFLCLRSMLR